MLVLGEGDSGRVISGHIAFVSVLFNVSIGE